MPCSSSPSASKVVCCPSVSREGVSTGHATAQIVWSVFPQLTVSCLRRQEMGTAREIVNRVQKMRKKAGLQATDPVAVLIDAPPTNGEAIPALPCQCQGLIAYLVVTCSFSVQSYLRHAHSRQLRRSRPVKARL